jgi:hypothetical protein
MGVPPVIIQVINIAWLSIETTMETTGGTTAIKKAPIGFMMINGWYRYHQCSMIIIRRKQVTLEHLFVKTSPCLINYNEIPIHKSNRLAVHTIQIFFRN